MTVYTVREAAAQLKIHPKTVEAYCRRGRIPATKIGRVWRIPEESLRGFFHYEPSSSPVNGHGPGWPMLAAIKLSQIWSYPEEVEYPL
jgi:excisionase family DNA binding protein